MIDLYDYEERICICMESGISFEGAESTAKRQFVSKHFLTAQDKRDAEDLGWSKMKFFRMKNQEVTTWV